MLKQIENGACRKTVSPRMSVRTHRHINFILALCFSFFKNEITDTKITPAFKTDFKSYAKKKKKNSARFFFLHPIF